MKIKEEEKSSCCLEIGQPKTQNNFLKEKQNLNFSDGRTSRLLQSVNSWATDMKKRVSRDGEKKLLGDIVDR